MRSDFIFFTLVILLFSGAPNLRAANLESISVQWYEPKVQPTDVAGLTFVNLIGWTEPNVSVQVNPKSIIVIQPTDANNKVLPRVGETLVKSDAKGFFRLRLFMPNGLSQVPILFRNSKGVQHTVLLTMRVDPKDVSLNVKVIRPTKTKIVTVLEKPPVEYSLGVSWAPLMFNETLSPTGLSELNMPLTSYQALRVDSSVKSTKWWWLLHYEMASATAPSSLSGKTIKSGSANMQSTMLGGRYRLTNSDQELWLGLDVDAKFFPLLAVSSANEVYLIDAKLFRVGLGLSYLFKSEPFDYATTVFYREPIAIKVNSGEVAFTSKYTVGLRGEMNYHWSDNWTFGTAAEAETSSFSYEYNNSPSLIANKGSGSLTIFQILAQAHYIFGEKKKDPPKN